MSATNERERELTKMSNLISEMTMNGATPEEMERAILYSADVIRAGKEDIDWKQSWEGYLIVDLEDKYLDSPADISKDYIVIDENYIGKNGSVGRGSLLGEFDTYEEAEDFVKTTERPSTNLRIFGPKVKEGV